jgi:hypothetical protein
LLGRDTIDGRRVFCLTLNPSGLERIRKNRLQRDLIDDDTRGSNYADRKYLMKDLVNAKRLTDDYDWTEIDVTGRAVEETSTLISFILKERFPEVNGMLSTRLLYFTPILYAVWCAAKSFETFAEPSVVTHENVTTGVAIRRQERTSSHESFHPS